MDENNIHEILEKLVARALVRFSSNFFVNNIVI